MGILLFRSVVVVCVVVVVVVVGVGAPDRSTRGRSVGRRVDTMVGFDSIRLDSIGLDWIGFARASLSSGVTDES